MDIDYDNIIESADSQEFYGWLELNCNSASVVWLRIFKKKSGRESIYWEESVRVALCWGWIDGIKKSLDELSYVQRFTPRRPKSNWSQRNCKHVESLIEKGLMQAPGLVAVDAAKKDGRWDAAYAPPSEMKVPQDFVDAVNAVPSAKDFYRKLNKSNLYSIAVGLTTAKKPETRQRRFEKLLAMMENGTKP